MSKHRQQAVSPDANKEPSTFDTYVIRDIRLINKFGIKDVIGLQSIDSRHFDRAEYMAIKALLETGNIAAVKELPHSSENTGSFLEIMQFIDQRQRSFIVTVYDSKELWDDPQIIELFSLPAQ